MSAAFKITKREITKESIGQKLRTARIEKDLSFETIEEKTKIRLKYLRALEKEDWDVFPCVAYIPGLLKSYARYLGLSSSPLITQYKRERGVESSLNKGFLSFKKEIKYPKIYITPTLLFIIFLAIVFLGVFVYIGYQVSGFAGAPYLLVKSPGFGETVGQNPIPILGKTSKGASIYINGQLLPIDSSGNFKQEVKLKEGSNNISIASLNRAGKKTEKELIVIYKE